MNWFSDNGISLLNGLATGSLLFVLAIGLSLTFGLVQTVNLAHGSLFLLGAYTGYSITTHAWPGAFAIAAVLGALVGGVGAGLLWTVTRQRTDHLDQALLTLGIAFVAADLISAGWGNDVHPVNPPTFLDGTVGISGNSYPVYRLALTGVGIALAILVYLVFERTRLGALVRAAVADSAMLAALGVRTWRVVAAVFVRGGVLAGLAGVMGGPVLGAYPGEDTDVLILALTVVVIGGLGSIPGAFVGAIVIGELQTLGVALVPKFASVLMFAVMAAVLAVRPQGLLGSRSLVYK